MQSTANAFRTAKAADEKWEAELRRAGVNRWSSQSAGEVGSLLHAAYMGKISADQNLHAAFERDRAADAEKRDELRNEIANQGDC